MILSLLYRVYIFILITTFYDKYNKLGQTWLVQVSRRILHHSSVPKESPAVVMLPTFLRDETASGTGRSSKELKLSSWLTPHFIMGLTACGTAGSSNLVVWTILSQETKTILVKYRIEYSGIPKPLFNLSLFSSVWTGRILLPTEAVLSHNEVRSRLA